MSSRCILDDDDDKVEEVKRNDASGHDCVTILC